MKVINPSRSFIETVCFLLLVLFTYTGINKVVDSVAFEYSLRSSILTRPFAGILRWLIPVAELIVVSMLLFPESRRPGLLAAFFLLALFTLYVAGMLLFTTDLPCSCGGVINKMSWKQHLVFNLIFTLLSGQAYRVQGRPQFNDKLSVPRAPVVRSGDTENLEESRYNY